MYIKIKQVIFYCASNIYHFYYPICTGTDDDDDAAYDAPRAITFIHGNRDRFLIKTA